jgi:transcriptional regulator with XRE-family HTH domain
MVFPSSCQYKPNRVYLRLDYKCKLYSVTYGNNISVTFVIKYIAMKERLIQLLDLEQLSPSKFADLIGVQRSSISHVLSGRNKPSFDFLQKTLKAFPGLNASWLMLGEGTMYERMGRTVSGNLFDNPEAREVPSDSDVADFTDRTAEIPEPEKDEIPEGMRQGQPAGITSEKTEIGNDQAKEAVSGPIAGGSRRIVQVMVLYNDDTFRSFKPAQ